MKRNILIGIILICFAVGVIRIVLIRATVPDPISPEEAKLVADLPGSTVLHVPLLTDTSLRQHLSDLYHKPVVDRMSPPHSDPLFSRYGCVAGVPSHQWNYSSADYTKTLNLLRSKDIRTIVILKSSLHEAFLSESCKDTLYWWYSLVPEQLTLAEHTQGDVQESLILSHQPRLKVRIFFSRNGTFFLNGFVLYPDILDDAVVTLPDHTQLNYAWEPLPDRGIRTPEMQPPVSIIGAAGDHVDILSTTPVLEQMYVTVFYRFVPDAELISPVKPSIEKRYSTNTMDIYQVN